MSSTRRARVTDSRDLRDLGCGRGAWQIVRVRGGAAVRPLPLRLDAGAAGRVQCRPHAVSPRQALGQLWPPYLGACSNTAEVGMALDVVGLVPGGAGRRRGGPRCSNRLVLAPLSVAARCSASTRSRWREVRNGRLFVDGREEGAALDLLRPPRGDGRRRRPGGRRPTSEATPASARRPVARSFPAGSAFSATSSRATSACPPTSRWRGSPRLPSSSSLTAGPGRTGGGLGRGGRVGGRRARSDESRDRARVDRDATSPDAADRDRQRLPARGVHPRGRGGTGAHPRRLGLPGQSLASLPLRRARGRPTVCYERLREANPSPFFGHRRGRRLGGRLGQSRAALQRRRRARDARGRSPARVRVPPTPRATTRSRPRCAPTARNRPST